ncbi:MAG: HEPN domain-containing protein, partial [Bacteroidota bacterium]
SALTSIEVELTSEIKEEFSKLDEMIKRRHNIVHQADRERTLGQDAYEIRPLQLEKVIEWINSVDNFILELARQL